MNESLLFPTWLVLVNQELISFHFLTRWSRPWSLCSLIACGSFQRFVGVVCTHVQFLSLSSLFQSVFYFHFPCCLAASDLHCPLLDFIVFVSLLSSLLPPSLPLSHSLLSLSLPPFFPSSSPSFFLSISILSSFFPPSLPLFSSVFSLLCKTTMQKQYSYWENLEAPQRNTNCTWMRWHFISWGWYLQYWCVSALVKTVPPCLLYLEHNSGRRNR